MLNTFADGIYCACDWRALRRCCLLTQTAPPCADDNTYFNTDYHPIPGPGYIADTDECDDGALHAGVGLWDLREMVRRPRSDARSTSGWRLPAHGSPTPGSVGCRVPQDRQSRCRHQERWPAPAMTHHSHRRWLKGSSGSACSACLNLVRCSLAGLPSTAPAWHYTTRCGGGKAIARLCRTPVM